MPIVLLLAALFLASLNMRPVITSVAPLLSNIQGDLGMSGLTASLLTTLPVLCMGVFAPVAVKISRKIGMERAILYSMILIGAATAARAVTNSSGILILTAFLSGIGIGIAGPLLSGFIKAHFPGGSALVSVYSASLVFGASLAAGLSVPLYTLLGNSWQKSLAIWAILAIAAILVWWKVASKPVPVNNSADFTLPLTNKRAWLLTVFFGMMASVFYSLTAWLAPIVSSMGYTRHEAGNLLTLFTLIQIPVSIIIPILVAKYKRRTFWLVLCSLFELVGIITLISAVSPFLSAILLGIGAGGLFPLALMLPIIEAQRPEEVSSWSAMNQGGGYILGAAGPLLIGRIYDWTGEFRLALMGLMVVIVLMIGVQLWIGRGSRSPVVAVTGEPEPTRP
ncbi:MFS transporter [Bacillus sp. FJAT-27264]|uniref:MFS transporter n=1 Tax=Paenibacillus sp. (strain DSM 101736 / FJAT-27264) TaxID=1850362 RepID=UPI000807BC31|nr:MFS transporter [Bacillus sp. FJAT-27264]OBZ08444.1 MFS transporter [Bacillus sp. FJAT-27264]